MQDTKNRQSTAVDESHVQGWQVYLVRHGCLERVPNGFVECEITAAMWCNWFRGRFPDSDYVVRPTVTWRN